MSVPQIFESEYRFCLILWEHEPVNSTQLVHLCQEQLGWSKATTYTVIRRLSQRGVVKNENAVVTSLVTKEQVQQSQIDQLVDKTFEGSRRYGRGHHPGGPDPGRPGSQDPHLYEV